MTTTNIGTAIVSIASMVNLLVNIDIYPVLIASDLYFE